MTLTTHTDYAVRTLMYLAVRGGRANAVQVAQFYGVSSHHMAKVVQLLARLGYVRTIRGAGGGIELACRPEQVRMGDLIESLEGNLHLLDCVSMDGVCMIESFCRLKKVLRGAEQAQIDYLNGFTLLDVTPTKRQLNRVAASE